MNVLEATTDKHFALTAKVLGGFPDHQRMRYASDIEIVERYFDNEAYDMEMRELKRVYSDPGGAVILALENDTPVGGVCLKKLDSKYCEMKRLFVPVKHRRKGIGRALSDELLRVARREGFSFMRLDTGTFMVESHHLYRNMGFKMIEPYYEVDPELQRGLYFMELAL